MSVTRTTPSSKGKHYKVAFNSQEVAVKARIARKCKMQPETGSSLLALYTRLPSK
jgi:hypothetical protein